MAYLAALVLVAFVVFAWPLWPGGIALIAGLVIADIALET